MEVNYLIIREFLHKELTELKFIEQSDLLQKGLCDAVLTEEV
jgi:hypothetical protein